MLPLLPSSSAATRAFCDRPAAELRRRGFEVEVYAPSSPERYLSVIAQRGLRRRVAGARYWYGTVVPRRLVQIVRALRADVIFVQRGLFRPSSPPVLETALWLASRLLGRKIVYHCDDSLHAVARPGYYRARFRMADVAATGTEEVAAFARSANPNVRMLTAGIPVDRYAPRQHRFRERVTIGWVGSHAGHFLDPLLPALREVARQRSIEFVVVSDAPPETGLPDGAVRWLRWRLDDEFAAFEGLDIGVMPLEDTEYARGKEAYKIKEYMAAGLPVVCSPVGSNRRVVEDGVTGFFAATTEEWIAALLRLIDDHELRRQTGGAARAKAEAEFGIERSSRDLAGAIGAAAGHGDPARAEECAE